MNQVVTSTAELESGALTCETSTADRPAARSGGRFYRPELDALRLLAFLLVFLHHAAVGYLDPISATPAGSKWIFRIFYGIVAGGSFGVCLFFVLSAFLIFELLLRERATTSDLKPKQFYIRRILRIWPLYFVALIIAMVAMVVTDGNRAAIPWAIWSAFLAGNWFVVIHGFPESPFDLLWSISVEEQFYLAAPWVVKFFSPRRLVVFSFILVVIANVWLFVLGAAHAHSYSVGANSFVQFQNFAAGILLCLLLRTWSPKFGAWQRLMTFLGAVICWICAIDFFKTRFAGDQPPGSWHLIGGYGLVSIGCCLFFLAFWGADSKLFPSWLIYLGRISYGLYVFHMLCMYIVGHGIPFHHAGVVGVLLKGALAMAMTILLALISYRYLETPFLRLKKRHEIVASRPI
ncbi:MAG TPA: acyltransferase [Terracidiphilus sp.]|nr:acyltransferase [Terracidiphilus sp.]